MATPNADQTKEIGFLSGITDAGTLAAQSFWTWNEDEPATYGPQTLEAKWGTTSAGAGATITYTFAPGSQWTAAEQAAFRATFSLWSAVANISFQQVSNTSATNIIIFRASDGSAEAGIERLSPSSIGSQTLGRAIGGGISIDTSVAGFGPIGGSFSAAGGYPWTTLIHEVGHVIGLGHSGAYDEGTTSTTLPYTPYDSRAWSIMSYIESDAASAANTAPDGGQFAWGRANEGRYSYARTPTTWMPLDILAAQRIYGAPVSTPLSGGQVFGFHTNVQGDVRNFFDFTVNTSPVVTLWDAGGNNTLDLSGFAAGSIVHLSPGSFSSAAGLSNNIGIAFGTRIDSAIGGSAHDQIYANDDGDVLTGGGGGDDLIGGAGRDIFRDTAANMNGDALRFGAGDRIEIADASLATFGFSAGARGTQGLTLGSGARITGVDTATGRLAMTAAAGGGVALSVANHDAALQDFAGDGHSDLVWRNSGGAFSTWALQTNITAAPERPNTYLDGSVDTSWSIQDTFDWNGDGYADLLWRNVSGAFTVWTANGSNGFTRNATADASVAPRWTIAGTGDFNGDGRDDLVWRDSSGVFTIWSSTGPFDPNAGAATDPGNPTGFAKNSYVDGSVATDWHIQAVADFNGDGKSDLLWRNDNGGFTEWQSNGSGFIKNVISDSSVDTSWHLAGARDFNGDGEADLLWRNDGGGFTEWQSTGTGFVHNTYVDGTVDTSWSIASLGDYNGDGAADILWRQTGGACTVWQSTGAGFLPNVLVDSSVGRDWSIATHHYDLV